MILGSPSQPSACALFPQCPKLLSSGSLSTQLTRSLGIAPYEESSRLGRHQELQGPPAGPGPRSPNEASGRHDVCGLPARALFRETTAGKGCLGVVGSYRFLGNVVFQSWASTVPSLIFSRYPVTVQRGLSKSISFTYCPSSVITLRSRFIHSRFYLTGHY